MKPKLPADVKAKIALYNKKQLDVSELIKNYSLENEDLSNCTIENMNIPDENISNANFCGARIGSLDKITNWNRVKAIGCNFRHTKFIGTVWARHADFRTSSFNRASAPNVDYRFADFRGCDFCYTIFSVGTDKSLGSKFDEKFFKDMAEQWNIGILPKNEYDEYLKWKQSKNVNNN